MLHMRYIRQFWCSNLFSIRVKDTDLVLESGIDFMLKVGSEIQTHYCFGKIKCIRLEPDPAVLMFMESNLQ